MTDYEIAAETIEFFAENPDQRAVASGCCVYRTADGRKCAIGRHIPDARYSVALEGIGIDAKCVCGWNRLRESLEGTELDNRPLRFLTKLQLVHDEMDYVFITMKHVRDVLDACVNELPQKMDFFIGTDDSHAYINF